MEKVNVFVLVAVLCEEFFIQLPHNLEALSGSCVLIPCTFQIQSQHEAELQKDPKGIWYKNGSGAKSKVYSSKSTEENLLAGEITGDLSMKNCTTIFYNLDEVDTTAYYFRIVSGNLKYIYVTPVYINVAGKSAIYSICIKTERLNSPGFHLNV